MELLEVQERMLRGDFGPGVKKAMEILVSLGEALGAERLVKISSAHISGVSYASIGDAGLSFIEDFSSLNVRVKVPTTLNPMGMDAERWREMGISEEFMEKQMRILSAFKKMGVKITCTCTPYLVGNKPQYGCHISWAESSAVVYANSVLKAKTNRESGPSVIASAVTGYTPYCGFHLDSNRRPTHLVEVKFGIKSFLEASALGYFIGANVQSGVPLLRGFRVDSAVFDERDLLKGLSAGLATSGAISLFHLSGSADGLETLEFDERDLSSVINLFQECSSPEYVFIGCPHCSLSELKMLAFLISSGVGRFNVKLWIFTSRAVFREAKLLGYVKAIESRGAKVFCDTCPVVMPNELIYGSSVITNSCKAAYYLSSLKRVKVSLMDLKSIVDQFLR